MNTNFDFSNLKNKIKWKRAFAFFLSMVLLLTGIAIPDSLFGGSMTAYASASGNAGEDPRGEYYKQTSFPVSYLEQEEIHEITTEEKPGVINDLTWYRFTPSETTSYAFQASAPVDNRTITYGAVFTLNTKQGKYKRIKALMGKGSGYSLEAVLEAGTTYYFCAGYSKYPASEYEVSFFKNSIVGMTGKINGIEKDSLITTTGKSYILETDVTCIDGATPTYEWYIEDETGNKQPLSTTDSKYAYTETANSNSYKTICCTVTAGRNSKTQYFYLYYYAVRFREFSVNGNFLSRVDYQMNHTYTLKANAVSAMGKPLTYTWKKDEQVLQTGTNDTFLFTPTQELLGYNTSFSLYCEISDNLGNTDSNSLYFYHQPISNVKIQVNGKDTENYSIVYISQKLPQTLNVSATAESGRCLTYQWINNRDGSILGNGPSCQYTMGSESTYDDICCAISDGTYSYRYELTFAYEPISDQSLTVNGASASGNAIPVRIGETYQLKMAAKAPQGKTLTYQWGTMVNDIFTPLSGVSGDTYVCSITKAADILPKLVCRITDPDGNTIQQRCYMRYIPIYNAEATINGFPIQSLDTRPGQKYTLAVKAKGEPGKTLTYAWSINDTAIPNANTNTYSYTAQNGSDKVTCMVSDGTNSCESHFYMDSSRAAAYDFTINGVSTNIAYAYEGQQIVFALEDKYGMAGDIEWTWRTDKSSGSDKYKNQITLTMGKDSLEGECILSEWGSCFFTILPCPSHTYVAKSTTPATASADGAAASVCSKCGHTRKAAIAKISNIKLSKTALNYTGKNQNVTLSVSDRTGRQLKVGTDYDYTFNGKTNRTISAKNVGRYTVKVTFKGNYSGSRELAFTVAPPKVTLSKASPARKGFKAVWKKSKTKVTGYEIAYSTNKSFKKNATKTIPVKSYKTVSKAVKKLKAKKTYYVKIRAYQNIKVGKKTEKLYSKWSSAKKVKTRK